jgi:YVTN family beta-propeller protein
MLWNPSSNKLYCTDVDHYTVVIIDGETNQVTGSVFIGEMPAVLTWNSVDNKVYCSRDVGYHVFSIDGAGDTLLRQIAVGTSPGAMFYCPDENKLYVRCGSYDAFAVVDAHRDTTVGLIPLPAGIGFAAWHAASRHLVCTIPDRNSVLLIDCEHDSVVREISVSSHPSQACINSVNDLLYCECSGSVPAVSLSGDSVVARVTGLVPHGRMCAVPCPNKIYAVGRVIQESLYSIDCASHTVAARWHVFAQAFALLCDTINGKVYCADGTAGRLLVYDGWADTLLKTFAMWPYADALAWNTTDRRVYALGPNPGTVSVFRDVPGIEEQKPGAQPRPCGATMVGSVLRLNGSKPAILADLSGRKVLDLRPGVNDVSGLAPGVYFVRLEAGVARATAKIVLE